MPLLGDINNLNDDFYDEKSLFNCPLMSEGLLSDEFPILIRCLNVFVSAAKRVFGDVWERAKWSQT